MGRIICKVHGRQSFWEMCIHTWEEFENNEYPKMKELPGYGVKICEKCYEENNVGELQKISFNELMDLSEEEYKKYEEKLNPKYENLERRCKCFQCIKKIEIIHARKNSKELTFEAFENTLMDKDKEKIEQLKTILTSNFKFPKLQNRFQNLFQSTDAFFIKSGGVNYPFSITFYYITEKEDQKKLLKLIDDFFESIPQKQRHIKFYESENWITEKVDIGMKAYKGEEKLILERIVK